MNNWTKWYYSALPAGVATTCPIISNSGPPARAKPKFNIGDRVRTVTSNEKGKITLVDSDRLSYEINNFFWFIEEDLELDPNFADAKSILSDKKCTCGSHKVYGAEWNAHSSWCDLYEK